MKTKLAAAVALIALAGPVFGARWKPISVTPERSIYIDMDALVRNGNTVQAWDWQKFGTGQTSATWQGTFFWVKSLTNYHCVQRTTEAVLKVYFGNDGVEIKRTNLEGLQFPAAVEPDSLREKMLGMACNPPKPAIKVVVSATKPATETGPAETKSAEPVPKAVTSAPRQDTATPNRDTAKIKDPKTATADDKAQSKARAASADAVVPSAKPGVQLVNMAQRPSRSRTARTLSKKQNDGAVRLAKRKLRPELKCPPPGPVTASGLTRSGPQFTDASNDGMFN